ncbi:MAG: hypothetical protein CWE10_16530 [Symbiobacterium thermophilum]|uniref:THIF-type NAD/FAD binding fold domain-containing protein n=2 Tax=Symbiobacterium thermophilum TaxID=2734 RepID=A0A953LIZ2_SYMTR|nr:hypothetical protein [Symbiobacterium thermophilum]
MSTAPTDRDRKMTEEPRWFERNPELFQRHLREMEDLGFTLDEDALKKERLVRFRGVSRYDPAREIEITYPDGFPSISPTVRSPLRPGIAPLARHQDPCTGTLCVFGFADSRWHVEMEPLDIIVAAENLIREYQPGAVIPDRDWVPEPRVNHFEYRPGWSILIPPPFFDLSLDELRQYRRARIRLRKENRAVRAIVTHLKTASVEHRADREFLSDWAQWLERAQARNVSLRVVTDHPPFSSSNLDLLQWLGAHHISLNSKHDAWGLLVFPDEWLDRHQTRPAWLGIHASRYRANLIHCHPVSKDDYRVRTPFGDQLAGRTVLMVGCGSLGSATAMALAQEGLGKLILADPDIYEPGNAVRHQVGIQSFGRPKAMALAERIRSVAPFSQVKVLPLSVGVSNDEKGRRDFYTCFHEADLVVDTTGHQSVGHFLNDLCVRHGKPLVVASVTNGAWSAEVFRYRPGKSGCRLCWHLQGNRESVPSLPRERLIFAPGCNQPTFIGGAADVAVAGGLAARMITETLVNPDAGHDLLVWVNRDERGWLPRVETRAIPPDPRCVYCTNSRGAAGDHPCA